MRCISLKQATKTGDVVWIVQIISQQIADCRTNHSKSTAGVRVQLNPICIYGPTDVTATPPSLAPLKSRMVYLFGASLPSCPGKEAIKRVCEA